VEADNCRRIPGAKGYEDEKAGGRFMSDLLLQWYDSFCGFGGVTEGIKKARYLLMKIAETIAGINHDPKAIKTFGSNHKRVKTFAEDFKDVLLSALPAYIATAIRCFWASLECTNFSIAKGGLSRDADSRTLAEHMYRYIDYLISIGQKLHYIYIENVREFLDWGPLIQKRDKVTGEPLFDKKGKPVMIPDPARKGEDFKKWVKEIESRGYRMEYRLINAADFGAYTSRKRLFIIFAADDMPIAWPESTHAKKPARGSGLKKWKAVKPCLDLNDKGENIFTRKVPLKPNSKRRIYRGLVKHVPKGKPFLSQYNGGSDECRNTPLDRPCKTVTTENRFSLVQPEFMVKYYGSGENVAGLNDPAPTVTTKDRLALIHTEHLMDQQYGQSIPHPVDQPAGTITKNPKLNFITLEYSNGKQSQSLNEPSGSLLQQPKQKLVSAEFLMNTNFNNAPTSLNDPSPVVTADRHYHYLVNPQWAWNPASLEDPAFTLIARMDKAPPYLVTLETGEVVIEIYDTDDYWDRKIKEFMALHGIIAIYMRMLRIDELLKIQGFPVNYFSRVKGITKTDMKKFIGNAVVPVVAQKLVEALYMALLEYYGMEVRKAA
jgi:DNA (cytosine-5)-methyltransferase 1